MRARTLVAATLAVSCAACGGATERSVKVLPATPPPVVHQGHGLAVELPPGWQAASQNLTPDLGDPREVLAVGTYPLRYRDEAQSCAHIPISALADLGPRDAFVELQERGLDAGSAWTDFPARPARFGPQLGGRSEAADCFRHDAGFTDHWFGFTDRGRHFHVRVAFGPQTSAAVRRQAWAVLDGLRVDGAQLPDWRSAG
jgi:hypothetical protein